MSFIKNYYPFGQIFLSISLFGCGKNIPFEPAKAQLNFISFSEAETESIIVRSFVKGSNFTSLVDTFIINKLNSNYINSNDTLEILNAFGNDNGLKSKDDYQVYLPIINKTYLITEIVEELTHTRGGGIFSMDRTLCYNPIKSYKLNGILVSAAKNYNKFYFQK